VSIYVVLHAGRFMQFYREPAKYKGRTSAFVEPLGIERVRAGRSMINDSQGIGAWTGAEHAAGAG
jgi:NAD(P)H-nitrite reductase large subunit